jgi:MFS family permease
LSTVGEKTGAGRIGLVALLAGHIVSMLGSVVTTVAVPWLVLTSTGSAAMMGLISMASVVPALLAGVFAAPLADRFGIRRTLIVCEVAAAMAMAAIAATPDIGFLPLAALVAVKGALAGVGGRAQHVLLRPVSDAAGMQIIRTTAIYDGAGNVAMVTAAPLAGLLIFWIGPQGALWFDAASFVLAALLIGLLVHPPAGTMPDRAAAAKEPYFTALRRGAGHLLQDRLLFGMLVMTSVINLFTVANYAVFVPLWVDKHFGAAPAVGLILSSFACGAIAGNIAFTIFGPKLPQYLTFTISLVLCVAPRQLTLGLTDSLIVILVVSALCGVTQASIRPILGAMLYARVPVELQNRVFGMVTAVAGSSLAFGATIAGLAVAGFGLQPAIILSGSVCLVVTLIPLLRYRSRRPDTVDTAPSTEEKAPEDTTGNTTGDAADAKSGTP